MVQNTASGEEQIILKTKLFGGFEKRQVLSYIDNLRENGRKAEAELQEHMTQMSDARSQLTAQVSSFEKQLSQLEEQLAKSQTKVVELTDVIEDLNSEITSQKLTVKEKDRELSMAAEEKKQLQYKTDRFEFKSRKFDDLAMQIGTIIIEAKGDAQLILDTARHEADQIKNEAMETVVKVTDQMKGLQNGLSEAKNSLQEVLASLDIRLAEIDSAINTSAALTTGSMLESTDCSWKESERPSFSQPADGIWNDHAAYESKDL